MKHEKTFKKTLAAMAAVVVMAASGTALAQSAQSANVIVVDSTQIVRTSLAGQDLARQAENQNAELQAERARLEQEFRTEEQDLVRQQGILSPEAFEERRRTVAQRISSSQNELQDKARRFQIGLQRAEAELQRQLNPIYQELMRKHGANLVLDRRSIIMSGPGMDVTTEVVDELDQALPSIRLEIPAPGAS